VIKHVLEHLMWYIALVFWLTWSRSLCCTSRWTQDYKEWILEHMHGDDGKRAMISEFRVRAGMDMTWTWLLLYNHIMWVKQY
jgi:cytochrome c biogenesis protein ResB